MKTTRIPPRFLRCSTGVLLAATLLPFSLCAAPSIPAPERLLPDDTLVVLSMPDFARMREIYKTSPETQLLSDPAMKPFKDNFLSKWKEEFVQPLERDLGVHFEDYTSLPQGQLTLALTQNGWDGTSDAMPAVLLLLDTRDKSDQLKKNISELRKKWIDSGRSIKTIKIRGTDFSAVNLSSNEVPASLQKFLPASESDSQSADDSKKNATANQLVIGQFESLLLVGTSDKALDKVMAHLTGGSVPALGDIADFDPNRLAIFRDAPLFGWVNAKAFVNVLKKRLSNKDSADSANPLTAFDAGKIIDAVGIGGVRTIAFSVEASSEGSGLQLFVGVPESGRQGLLKILAGQSKDASPPPFVPADAIKFERWRIDGQKAWATLQQAMNDISPQLMSGINLLLDTAESASKEKDPNFDVKKSLFGNLGDDMISYQKSPRGGAGSDPNSLPSLFLLGSPHPEELSVALKSILQLLGQQAGSPTEREFLGHKIYTLQLPALPLPTSDPSGTPSRRTLNYATAAGYVVISSDSSMIEEYFRSSDTHPKALRDTAGLTEAAAKVGGLNTGWFGYENSAETSRIKFEALRKGGSGDTNGAAAFSSPMGLGANPLKDWMDFSLLPPFDKIAKYFYFTVYTGSASPNGITFKIYAPMPPQLRK